MPHARTALGRDPTSEQAPGSRLSGDARSDQPHDGHGTRHAQRRAGRARGRGPQRDRRADQTRARMGRSEGEQRVSRRQERAGASRDEDRAAAREDRRRRSSSRRPPPSPAGRWAWARPWSYATRRASRAPGGSSARTTPPRRRAVCRPSRRSRLRCSGRAPASASRSSLPKGKRTLTVLTVG